MASSEPPRPASERLQSKLKLVFTILSWLLFVAVAVFIMLRVRVLVKDQEFDWGSVHVGWVVLGTVFYGLSLLPQAWYFRRLIESARFEPTILGSFRAHVTGHLGKYIPGKTMVVIMRSMFMRREGVPILTTVWAALLETLVFIAVGGLIGILSLPYLLGTISPEKWESSAFSAIGKSVEVMLPWRGYLVVGVLLSSVLVVPIVTPLLDRLAARLSSKKAKDVVSGESQGKDSEKIKHITVWDVWRGMGWEALSWVLQAMSLVAVIYAWSNVRAGGEEMLAWGSMIAVSTVMGFLAFFTPGGLGVKDAILMELLLLCSPLSRSQAVAIAVTHRLISLIGEVCTSLVLWMIPVKKD